MHLSRSRSPERHVSAQHGCQSDAARPQPDTDPPQFLTAFSPLAEKLFSPVQERLLQFSDKVVFCIAVDRNCYVPMHNKKVSQPQRPRDPRLHLMRGTLLLERAQAGDAAAAAGAHTALLEAKRLLGDDLVRKDQLLALRRDVAIGLAWISMFVAGPDGGPDWSRVEREFTTVTTEWPDRADAFVGLGVALAAGGKLERGQAALERAIALDPGTAAAHHNLAKVLQLRGDLRGARSRLQEALRIRPDDAQSKAMLEAVERQLAGR